MLQSAAAVTSREVRTLDATHLTSGIYIDADELVAYDRRLFEAARRHGPAVASPGLA